MDFELGFVEEEVVIKVENEDGTYEKFSIKDLLNIIIDFINKLLKFEF